MELNRRGLLAMFGSAAAALAVAKTLPPDLREAVEQTLRDVDPPPGVSYQWNTAEMLAAMDADNDSRGEWAKWVRVPEDRHGMSEVGGLILCERPLEVTMAWHAENHRKALAMAGQLLDESGFTGHVGSVREIGRDPHDRVKSDKPNFAGFEWEKPEGSESA